MENGIEANSSAGDAHIEQTEILQLLRDHEATIKRLGDAIKSKEIVYQQLHQLHAEYEALRNGVGSDILSVYDARKTATESYILVLIDAQSHQFRENYVHGAESGGIKAADLLKNAVMKHCDSTKRETSSCRIAIRVYANLKKLSVDSIEDYTAKKPGFAKPVFPRGLGAFTAGFSRDDAFIDYVDVAGDAAVQGKICGLFEMSIKDPSCCHIFFGASGSTQYARVLREHLMFAEKITLIQRGGEDISLMCPGLQGVVFSEVFEPLKFARIGCGDTNKLHNNIESDRSSNHTNTTHSTIGSNQKKVFKARSLQNRSELLRSRSTLLAPLPLKGPPGTIPINAASHRLDMHMNAPTKIQWDEYEDCIAKRKLCDLFHVGQGCSNENCSYDHDPITFNERYCHRFMRWSWPCHTGGKCRNIHCFRGHVCHCEISKNGKLLPCKMSAEYHGIDRRVEKWVIPSEEYEGQVDNSNGRESHGESMPDIEMTVGNLIDL